MPIHRWSACRRVAGLMITLAGCLCAPTAHAQQFPWQPSSETHSWARFSRGAWKTVRVRTETFDEEGDVAQTSSTDTHIQLQRSTRNSISLCITSTLEVAGSEIAAPPKTIVQPLHNAVERVETLQPDSVRIADRECPTQVVRLVGTGDKLTRTSTVYYRTSGTPQVLKRVTEVKDKVTGEVTAETTVTVTDLDQRRDILGEFKSTWSVNTVEKRGGVTVLTREVQCAEVPGQLVSRVTEERNDEGQMIRRSTLELVGYGYGPRRPRRWFRHHR